MDVYQMIYAIVSRHGRDNPPSSVIKIFRKELITAMLYFSDHVCGHASCRFEKRTWRRDFTQKSAVA
jgi:hypothetical protein